MRTLADIAPYPKWPDPSRWVMVHLTSFVPGLEGAAVNDRRRHLNMWPRNATNAVRYILERTGFAPNAVRVAQLANGELELNAFVPKHGRQPIAYVWEGLTLRDAQQALAELSRARP